MSNSEVWGGAFWLVLSILVVWAGLAHEVGTARSPETGFALFWTGIVMCGLSVKPLVDAGKVRFLNIWTAQRVKSVPDVPTLRELGYPWVFDSPYGIAGPKNMDPKIVAKLHDAFKKAFDDPAVVRAMDQFEMVPNYRDPQGYKALVKEVTDMEKSMMDRLGILKKDKD